MTHLPVLSGDSTCKALRKIGYEVDHQTGSHIILRCNRPPYRRVTIPNHREIAKGTLRKIIREVGITVEEFKTLL
ncbi:MAG: type II toxin-antitoxin system HicA family toxin [Bacteroidota bacterium]|nr:type II toxin-antitoxin system HicA family toxin [Bacteroidota bacterium]